MAVAAASDAGISTRGFIGALLALTAISYGAIALAARSLNGRDDGIVAFVCGIAAVALAVMMTFFGGPAVAFAAILAATLAWYVAIVADDAGF